MKANLKILALVSTLFTTTVFASDEIVINLQNNNQEVKISTVQLIYHSSPNMFCGKLHNGAFVSKKEFVPYTYNTKITAKKTLKNFFCKYKLSNVVLKGPNFANYDVEYATVETRNSYSHSSLDNRVVSNTFNFSCINTDTDYGCTKNSDDINDISNHEIFIYID